MYLKEVKKYPILNREEYAALMELRHTDKAKYELGLYLSNQRFVIWIARKFLGRINEGSTLEYMDIIQEGNCGLLKAIQMFDPDKGFRFTTYATWWVKQYISRFFDDHWRSVRVPVHMMESIRRYMKVSNRLTHELGGDPTRDEVSQEMHIETKKAEFLQKISGEKFVSISGMNQESEGFNPLSFLASPDATPDIFTGNNMLGNEVRRVIKMTLKPKEYEILMMRYSLEDRGNHTLEEIGEKYGVSRERIRQIEAKAIDKISTDPALLKIARSCNFRIKKDTIERAKQKLEQDKQQRLLEELASLTSQPLAISSQGKPSADSIKILIETLAQHYGMDYDSIVGPSREQDLVEARHSIIYILRNEFKFSFPVIGKNTGDRDHTTIMHAFEKIETQLETDLELKVSIQKALRSLKTTDSFVQVPTTANIQPTPRNLSVIEIVKIVADFYHVEESSLYCKSSDTPGRAKRVAMYFLKEKYQMDPVSIGRRLGNQTDMDVITACDFVTKNLTDFNDDIAQLENVFSNS